MKNLGIFDDIRVGDTFKINNTEFTTKEIIGSQNGIVVSYDFHGVEHKATIYAHDKTTAKMLSPDFDFNVAYDE